MASAKESLLAFMASSGKSQRQVAREIGISSAQINQFLADKYEGDSDSTSDKILQYLAVAEKRLNTDKTVVFYPELHNTREALFTCSAAPRNTEIALLSGDAGAGKTEALTYYRDNNPGVILVTANACIQSATAILQLICAELGKHAPYRRNAIMNLLVAQLSGTNRLIIVDEADHLSLQAIQALRSLNDQAHVGVVLSGNNKIYLQSIARAPDDRATLETADSEDEETDDTSDITAYLRVGESQIIYKLSGDDFTTLMDASYNSLRHQQVFWGDFEDVTQIDITLEGESHTITSALEDDERVYSYNGSEIDLTDFTTALENLTADSFTSAAATGQEEISLTLHLDNEDFPTVTIQITRYDGSLCLASVDGESVSLVNRSDAMDLVEAVQSIVLGQSE